MKKTFNLEELGCANCAAKMEDAISRMDGVTAVNINFMAQKMTLEAPDDQFDSIVKQAQKTMRRIEPDVRVVM